MHSAELIATQAHLLEDIPGSSREGDDTYLKVVLVLDQSTRIIECRDGIQWIIQRKDRLNKTGSRWRGTAYCRTRARLEYRLPDHRDQLATLPAHFPEKQTF